MRRRQAAAVLLVGSILVSRSARADNSATAKALFDRGLADMVGARYESGCPAISESYKLDPRPGTLFTLAECEAKRGRVATALSLYDDYLSQYARLTQDKQHQQGQRRKIAIEQRALLAPEVALLTLLLSPDSPPSTTVSRDDAEVAAAAIGLALPVDPGNHVITIREPGRPPLRLEVSIAAREKKLVTLPRPPSAPLFSNQRIGALVAGGVGVAGLFVGVVAGGLTLAKKSTINAHCNFPGDPGGCDATGLAATSTAKTLSSVSTTGFVIAAAGVGTGLALWFTDSSTSNGQTGFVRSVRPDLNLGLGTTAPTTFSLRGAF